MNHEERIENLEKEVLYLKDIIMELKKSRDVHLANINSLKGFTTITFTQMASSIDFETSTNMYNSLSAINFNQVIDDVIVGDYQYGSQLRNDLNQRKETDRS
jgi:hypothetical protein